MQHSFSRAQEVRHRSPFVGIAVLAFVLVVGSILRLCHITASGLWLDEFTSIEVATKPLSDILEGRGFDSHTPPFYYVVLHGWFYWNGVSEFSLRLLSTLFDIANIFLVFVVFVRQFRSRVGALTAVIFALAEYPIYYAQEGRMYSMLLTLVLLTYFFILRIQDDSAGWFEFPLLLITMICGLYTHYYYALFLAAASAAIFLLCITNVRALWYWFGSLAVAVLAFLPWIRIVLRLVESGGQSFRTFTLAAVPYTFFRFVAGYAMLPLNAGSKDDMLGYILDHLMVVVPFFMVFGILFLWGIIKMSQIAPRKSLLICSLAFLPPTMALLLSLKAPMFSERYLIVSFPFFLAIFAYALEHMGPPIRLSGGAAVFALLVWALMYHFFSPDFGKEQWRDAVAWIQRDSGEIPAVVTTLPAFTDGLMRFYAEPELRVTPFSRLTALSQELCSQTTGPRPRTYLVQRGREPLYEQMRLSLPFRATYRAILPFESGLRIFELDPEC